MIGRGTTYGLLAAIVMATPAAAQTRAGGEFRVNTTTAFTQNNSAIAAGNDGRFVVIWTDRGGPIKGQRFNEAGLRLGAEFDVDPSAFAYGPGVAMAAKGDFVVVWSRFEADGSDLGVLAQRFDADGSRLGAELVVNAETTGPQIFPRVAFDGRGNFVVTWFTPIGGVVSLGGQRFDAAGHRLGGQFDPNTNLTRSAYLQDVSADSAGNFVVAWSDNDPSGASVEAQRFAADGARVGANFQVNTSTAERALSPDVAHAPDGSFAIAFAKGLPGAAFDIYARRFSAAGQALGTEFLVNTYTGGGAYPGLAMDGTGSFVVSWSANDGSDRGLRARRFLANGTARGSDFPVNTYTAGPQGSSAFASMVAGDGVGNFVIHWFGDEGTGSGSDIYAQRYGGLRPQALVVDSASNLVWEPGEAVDVRPAWRNVNGTSQTFGGALASISGPAGATYTISDAVGNYGTVANGASASCTNCYVVIVDDPDERPAAHWDVTATERLAPDTQGQQKQWTLHIGRSFGDVPPTGPFYRFVETLLHVGVTAGCGGAQYCPSASTSRAQMAVFLLLAKESSGFAPPACTTPVFGDVPASSPFCRYVEELARRGVTSGCGGGNYCPDDAVTRDQMAVFLLRTLDPALSPPACTTPVFGDVPASSPFCRWVEELVRRGITAGCGGGNYCPAQPVTREQMAAFLTTTFGLTLYGP